jgi:hypothetical protein
MRRVTRQFTAWARTKPRRASFITGIVAGLLFFTMTTTASHDLIWGLFSGLSTAIVTGTSLYSSSTRDRG